MRRPSRLIVPRERVMIPSLDDIITLIGFEISISSKTLPERPRLRKCVEFNNAVASL